MDPKDPQENKTKNSSGLSSFMRETEEQAILNAFHQVAVLEVIDTKGIILFANQKFCELTGYSVEQIIGHSHKKLRSGMHSQDFFKKMWQTILGGQIWRGDVCNRNKFGKYYWLDTTIIPIFDTKGEIEKFVTIRFDVTDRKVADQKMVQAAKMGTLNEMAGGISHEINNPLSVIVGKIEVMKNIFLQAKPDIVKLSSDLDKIKGSCERIAKIVRGLRIFSRTGDRLPFEYVLIDLVIQETLLFISERLKFAGVDLKIVSDPTLKIHCKPSQLSQVILNLISNSIEAIQGRAEKWIELKIVLDSPEVLRIELTDSGDGIPTHIAEHLMQPFFTTKEVGQGTGLGLSIAKGIIDDHHGQIYLDRECKNTRFVIKVPTEQIQHKFNPTQAFKKQIS